MWERIARWHLLQSGGQLGPPPVAEVGSWWSGQAQIDVVGVDRHSRSVVFGEARWRQELVTGRDLERLDPGVRRIMNPYIYHVSLTERLLRFF